MSRGERRQRGREKELTVFGKSSKVDPSLLVDDELGEGVGYCDGGLGEGEIGEREGKRIRPETGEAGEEGRDGRQRSHLRRFRREESRS